MGLAAWTISALNCPFRVESSSRIEAEYVAAGNWYISQLVASTWWLIRFDLWDFVGGYAYAQYGNFSIGTATNFYALTGNLGAYTGNACKQGGSLYKGGQKSDASM